MLLKNNWLEWKIIFFFLLPQGWKIHWPGDQASERGSPVQVGWEDPSWCPAGHASDCPHAGQAGLWPLCQPPQLWQARPESGGEHKEGEVWFDYWLKGWELQAGALCLGWAFVSGTLGKIKEFFGALSCAPRCVELNLLRAAQKVGELINSGKKNLSCLDFKLDGWAQFL